MPATLTPDPFPSFTALLKRALGARVDPDADGLLSLMAEDVVMEFPYAPPGAPGRVSGTAALADYLAEFARNVTVDSVADLRVHATTDPALVILEFTGAGRIVATGAAYRQTYISVFRTAGGRIVHYRDYWNPLALAAS